MNLLSRAMANREAEEEQYSASEEIIGTLNVGGRNFDYKETTMPIDKLEPITDQPFKVIQADVEILARSIERVGQLTPLLVSLQKDKYIVFSGNKRLAALKHLGRPQANVKIFTDLKQEDINLFLTNANVQRQAPTFTELGRLIHEYRNGNEELSLPEISDMFKVGTRTLYRLYHLVELTPDLQECVDDKYISTNSIEPISQSLKREEQQIIADFCQKYEKKLSVKVINSLIEFCSHSAQKLDDDIIISIIKSSNKKPENIKWYTQIIEAAGWQESLTEEEVIQKVLCLLVENKKESEN